MLAIERNLLTVVSRAARRPRQPRRRIREQFVATIERNLLTDVSRVARPARAAPGPAGRAGAWPAG